MSQTTLPADSVLWAQHEFTVEVDCSKFKPIQISYLNKYGVRDYWTFTKRNTLTINTERDTYYRDLGTWGDSTWDANSWDRGTKVFNQIGRTRMTISTDWVSEERAAALEQLFTSPEVKAYIDDEWIAVTITTQSYEQKTNAREFSLLRYELEIEFSVPKQRQRG
jgi:hypothetical protein